MLFFILGLTFAKTLILTPKPLSSIIDLESFNIEHNIHQLATFDDIIFYKTDSDQYKNTLANFYDIEDEQIYSVNSIKRFLINSYKDLAEQSSMYIHEYFGSNETIPWHLSSITNREPTEESTFKYTKCNTNKDILVNIYVVDTGSEPLLANFADSENHDCNGHGSLCSSLIRDSKFGVCKDSNVYGIKVLNCQGSGSTSSVIQGLEFAFKLHKENTKKEKRVVKSIVNMSLGGGLSRAINKAVENTIKDPNFYFVAASGNEGQDIKNVSPASAKGIISVMASDKNNNRAYFSNYGGSLYSPGVAITGLNNYDKEVTMSGTSFSSPILAGTLVHYINDYPTYNMKQMKKLIQDKATKNVIKNNPEHTLNLLTYLVR